MSNHKKLFYPCLCAFVFSMPPLVHADTRTRDVITFDVVETGYDIDRSLQLTSLASFTNLSARRVISAHIELDWALPPGITVELWIAQGRTYPWKQPGAVPEDRWVMTEKTGTLVKFNVKNLLRKAVSQRSSLGSLYIRFPEEDQSRALVRVQEIQNLELVVHHRSQ